MFGHSPAIRRHAIRTGSWLAREALTKAGGRRRLAALCVVAGTLSLAPFVTITADAEHPANAPKTPAAHRHHLPQPGLEWPLEISGSQYAPVAWSDVEG